MRVIFVSETPDRIRGGIERHAAAMVAELVGRGHDARLVRPSDLRPAVTASADWVVFDGVHRWAILRHAQRRLRGPGLVLIPHGSFLEEARRRELAAGGIWRPTLQYFGRRSFDGVFGRRAFGRFERWFALADPESADLQSFLGIPPARIDIEGPFVTAEFLAAAAESPEPPPVPRPYVCSISRIDRRKNYGRLLEALDGSPYRFLLAGQDRGGLSDLEARARKVPGTRWQYLGTVSESQKVSLIRGSEAVIVPSVSEGVPALAVEALALGRPVILAGVAYGPQGAGVIRCGSDVGSLREAIASLATRSPAPPIVPPTVAGAVDRFLKALAR
ncbi:MAG: glycosyltransferase family 4 protein [Thermoplasmata archaeon]|nr:glycosyltransferase family 4 protein [Thermoplasmata archaeon]